MGTNTGLGIGIGIPFKNNALGGDRPYLPPELKARLIGVWDNYGKKNTDADRNIIKNKIPNAGGDLEIRNAAYEGMSGHNGYPVVFGANKTWKQLPTYNSIYSINGNKIHITKVLGANRGLIFNYVKQNDQLYNITEIPSFKIRVSGLKGDSKLRYSYIKTENAVYQTLLDLDNGIHKLPKSLRPTDSIINGSWIGFTITPIVENEITFDCDITIEVLPEYEGAFVTDGIDDLITSTKTVQEMLGGSNEITVVSMIHQIADRGSTYPNIYNNQIRYSTRLLRSTVTAANVVGKTGIYGYTATGVSITGTPTGKVVNDILGDKNDYPYLASAFTGIDAESHFSVEGYLSDSGNINETSKVAWYWTIIANKVLTTDQINQVIAYFNLDRTLKPDILCNVKKQGITNENHAEFGDKLIDFSGNGRDIQLNNLAWKGNSGIGRYTEEFKESYWFIHKEQAGIIKDNNSVKVVGKLNNTYIVYHLRNKATNSFKVRIKGIKTEITYNYISSGQEQSISLKEDGIYDIPASEAVDNVFTLGFYFRSNDINLDWTGFTIEIIPSNAGALCLDGVTDFGSYVGDLGLKDYTFIADRAYDRIVISQVPFIASTYTNGQAPFLMEYSPDDGKAYPHSFGHITKTVSINKERQISYQSTYVYNRNAITKGTSIDTGDGLTIGNSGVAGVQYSALCLYSLLLFPYSMSEFLIERQLKKHKLGTLYPDMVEFRPVIKSNISYDKIDFFDETGAKRIYPGDYVEIGATIKANLYLNNFDISTITSVTSNQFESVSANRGDKYYDLILEGIKKSPQKITMNIQLDENYVQFNPVINSNYDYRRLDFYLGAYTKLINIGDYIPKGTYIRANLYLKNDIDKLVTFTFNGVNIGYKRSLVDNTAFNIDAIYNYDSPQVVNITIEEYIRYEDIVQPYPVLLRFKDESDKEVSWGNKIKVGSSITRIGSFNDCNLLKGIYTVSNAKLNGSPLPSTPHVVEKQMVFTCTATYLLDDNEPKCILSPSRLRIPNSSYKLLGYIPDISGHGNHGVIHNSAYAEMSGANGYPYDYNSSNFTVNANLARKINSEKIEYFAIGVSEGFIYNDKIYNGKVKITGVNNAISNNEISNFRIYSNTSEHIESSEYITITKDGIYNIDIKGTSQNASKVNFFAVTRFSDITKLRTPIYIEQVGEYEGAYCLDGVNDFITIPTTVGGKQVLMKVNWQKSPTLLYDQRVSGRFAVLTTKEDDAVNSRIAYQGRNPDGKTYIDGIENNNIETYTLKDITHNITIANSSSGGVIVPVIGCNTDKTSSFAKMSLYDFMLFDEISTDDKIKELNEYVGIEAKVEKPDYYWDNYGKKNTDARRGYIDEQVSLQKTGTSINSLENFNIGYEGMSGYNGYPVVLGANKTWETSNAVDYIYDINSTIVHITNVKHAANGLLYSYVKKDGALANIKEIPAFRVTVKGLEGNSKLVYKYLATENATKESIVYLGNGTHKLPKSFVPTDALLDLTTNSWIGFTITPVIEAELVFDCDITIEVLPEYENGLAYDGISDFTDNKNIPILTDFTALIKRVDLDAKNDNSTVMFKGNKIYESSIGNGFILDYCYNSKNYVYSYGKLNQIERDDSKIIYLTPESYNGNPIIKGENEDNLGLVLGKYWKGVIYKTILYSKTIPLLQINFLKNLMEKDEIIDLTNPIFIKDE